MKKILAILIAIGFVLTVTVAAASPLTPAQIKANTEIQASNIKQIATQQANTIASGNNSAAVASQSQVQANAVNQQQSKNTQTPP